MHNLLPRRFPSFRVLLIALLVLFSSLLTGKSAHADDVSITVNVAENRDPAFDCQESPPTWEPYSTNGSDISASPGVSSDLQIDPGFSVSEGQVDCGGIWSTPTGSVSASITVPAGWESSVSCAVANTCITPDFFGTDHSYIDASVTPPAGFGEAYSETVVVTLTWTP
jgi:hypothetical protein